MSESINITINGQSVQAEAGQMLIDVADANGITIPRFCYHKKLSVAANCRMCLVEVEKAPKPMPACATPINDGMVVNTRSEKSIAAQKSTMEFLLINHPLDCPVCDQGGECELQDVAMGFGGDVSQYTDKKRVVKDKNLGSLISAEMTRCIHCTRCVRFSEEIAGMPELGATGRGEHVEIGTYIEKSVTSEMSGNVIDVCPVGALTAKPSRFSARCWEMTQHPSIAPHDCVGSNINVHTINNEVVRVVPRDNEAVNECWISDRDRFSYAGLKSDARLLTPKIKKDGQFVDASWQEALDLVAQKFSAQANKDGNKIAALVSPSATLEEQFLTQKLIRSLGSKNIDYRLKQSDFSAEEPVMPWLGQGIADLEDLDAAVFIASNPRKEQPILAHRIRKAVNQNGAEVSFINHIKADVAFEAKHNISASAEKLVHELASVVQAAADIAGGDVDDIASLLEKVKVKDEHKALAQSLINGEKSSVFIGQQAINSPYYSLLKNLAQTLAKLTASHFGLITAGANASGAALSGCTPFAKEAGEKLENCGMNTAEILVQEDTHLLLVGVDPQRDLLGNLDYAAFSVAMASYFDADAYADVDVLLPIAAFTETSGTYVNIEGRWQSFQAAVVAKGESRPGWKIVNSLMRVLLPAGQFDYDSSKQAVDELKELCANVVLNNVTDTTSKHKKLPSKPRSLQSVYEESLYAIDEQVRSSAPLAVTQDAINQSACAMCESQAKKEGLLEAITIQVSRGEVSIVLPFRVSNRVAEGCISIPQSIDGLFGAVKVEKAS